MERIVPYSTRTGVAIKAFVEAADWSFKESVTSPGAATFSFDLRGLGLGVDVNERLVSGWETTWAVESNPAPAFSRVWTIEYAGLVVDYDFDEISGVVDVHTFEFAKILEARPLWGTHGIIADTFDLSGETLGDVIREVLWYAVGADRNDVRWPLPVELGQLSHGPLERPEWRYHFRTATAILDDLSAEDGSPDWVLRPVKDGDLLRWKLELGTPYLAGLAVRLPVSTSSTPVASQVMNLRVRHDFQSERTGVNVMGAGSEVDMRWGTAGTGQVSEARADIPALIGVEAYKTIDDTAQLHALAVSELRSVAGGVKQYSFEVQTGWGERIKPGDIRAGSTILLDHPGSELVRRGRIALYVLSVSRGPDGLVSVESQGMR